MIIMTQGKGSRLRISADIKDVSIDLSFLTQESYYNGSYETDVLTDDQSAAMPPRSNTRFSQERYDDEFEQMSATISGSINDDIDFVLNTSIFERYAYTYDYASYVEYDFMPDITIIFVNNITIMDLMIAEIQE